MAEHKIEAPLENLEGNSARGEEGKIVSITNEETKRYLNAIFQSFLSSVSSAVGAFDLGENRSVPTRQEMETMLDHHKIDKTLLEFPRILYGKIFFDGADILDEDTRPPLTEDEHRKLFDFLWSINGLPNELKSNFPVSLKRRIIENREALKVVIGDMANGKIEDAAIALLKRALEFQLTKNEKEFLWEWFAYEHADAVNRTVMDLHPAIESVFSKMGDYKELRLDVLDMGCGYEGRMIRGVKEVYGKYFTEFSAYGIDMRVDGKARPEVTLKDGEIENMPFEGNSFDIIYESFVMKHFNSPQELPVVLREIGRVLKPGGIFIWTDAFGYSGDGIANLMTKQGISCSVAEIETSPGSYIIMKKENEYSGKVSPVGSIVVSSSLVKSQIILNKKGGIDLHALPIQIESVASSALGALSGGRAFRGDLDAEWTRIQDVFNAGIRPSIQRLSEYTAAAVASPLSEKKIDEVRVMLADILRRDEESQKLVPAEESCKQLLSALELR